MTYNEIQDDPYEYSILLTNSHFTLFHLSKTLPLLIPVPIVEISHAYHGPMRTILLNPDPHRTPHHP